jgi:hypothetical protein
LRDSATGTWPGTAAGARQSRPRSDSGPRGPAPHHGDVHPAEAVTRPAWAIGRPPPTSQSRRPGVRVEPRRIGVPEYSLGGLRATCVVEHQLPYPGDGAACPRPRRPGASTGSCASPVPDDHVVEALRATGTVRSQAQFRTFRLGPVAGPGRRRRPQWTGSSVRSSCASSRFRARPRRLSRSPGARSLRRPGGVEHRFDHLGEEIAYPFDASPLASTFAMDCSSGLDSIMLFTDCWPCGFGAGGFTDTERMTLRILGHGHLCTSQLKRSLLHRPSDRLSLPTRPATGRESSTAYVRSSLSRQRHRVTEPNHGGRAPSHRISCKPTNTLTSRPRRVRSAEGDHRPWIRRRPGDVDVQRRPATQWRPRAIPGTSTHR